VSVSLRRLLVPAALLTVAWLVCAAGSADAATLPRDAGTLHLSAASVLQSGLGLSDPPAPTATANALDPSSDASSDSSGPQGPKGPAGPSGAANGDSSVNVNLGGLTDKPSTSITVLLVLTLLSLLPAIVLTCTSFTKVLVVLSLTRNALGLQQTPPNQVLAGLALFLSLFIMSPTLSDIYHDGVKPYLDGDATTAQAWDDGMTPLRTFMLKNADDDEIQLLSNVAERDVPDSREDTPTTTLIPAFILSELKDAFIIGFIIFIPFLIIDIVVSGALMALGMMMMPPVMVSLPFKLLLFVLVNGWGLIITALVGSYK
jgi:flagellar biosynthetic protein FliP